MMTLWVGAGLFSVAVFATALATVDLADHLARWRLANRPVQAVLLVVLLVVCPAYLVGGLVIMRLKDQPADCRGAALIVYGIVPLSALVFGAVRRFFRRQYGGVAG